MEAITGWGQEIIANPDCYNNHFHQTFIVLNYCRMLHDLYAGFPGSKLAGAEWAKANLEPSWSALIDRAWDGRPDPASSVRRPAAPEDFESALKFVEHIIEKSKHYSPQRA
jgi:Aminoglycoside adenylyltransferase, C-terminal domain